MNSKILVIYLPQFHRIPENDQWWGDGFTEWVNVKRGHPFYPGHYQPRIPIKKEYYDLADLRILEKHCKLAKRVGIFGFCFYHYYFEGKTLLEKPIENYRNHSKEQFPYCLIWANQSWKRTWYRATKNRQVLRQQSYGTSEDWKAHFYYLLHFFKDQRYIKVDNKPIYIIYIPQDIPCRKQMFKMWNELAKENGFNGIYLIAMKTSYGEDEKSNLYDAYMDFEPMYTLAKDCSWRKFVEHEKKIFRKDYYMNRNWLKNFLLADNIFSYNYLVRQAKKRFICSENNTYAGVFAGWDNTARKDEDGLIVTGCSPVKFSRALAQFLELSDKYNKQFIFINAWNEWSEGAYLEPDEKYGYAYLNSIKKIVKRRSKMKNLKV